MSPTSCQTAPPRVGEKRLWKNPRPKSRKSKNLFRTAVNKIGWCRLSDSNRRPTAYKAVALPTELKRRLGNHINMAPPRNEAEHYICSRRKKLSQEDPLRDDRYTEAMLLGSSIHLEMARKIDRSAVVIDPDQCFERGASSPQVLRQCALAPSSYASGRFSAGIVQIAAPVCYPCGFRSALACHGAG